MRTINTLIAIVFSLIFIGCSTTPVYLGLPQNRLDSPESYGAFGAGRFHLGHRSTQKITLSSDYGTDLIKTHATDIQSVADHGLGLGLGLLDFIDLDTHLNNDAQSFTQLKFQVLGKNRRESQPGDYSLSILGGYDPNTVRSGENSALTLSGNTLTIVPGTAAYTLQSNFALLGFVGGYRINSELLTYAGYSRSWVSYSGTQTLLDKSTGDFSGKIEQNLYSAGLILSRSNEIDKKDIGFFRYSTFFAQIELDLSNMSVGSTSKTQLNGALNIGVDW